MNKKQINELGNVLKNATRELNEKLKKEKGLWRKCAAGQEFFFRTEEFPKNRFQIFTEYLNGGKKIYAAIEVGGKNLKGYIIPTKEYAELICSGISTFACKYKIGLRKLSNFIKVLN